MPLEQEVQTDQNFVTGGEGRQPEDLESRAKRMGWRPRNEWRDDESKFVDAKTFVERGESFIPFLRRERGVLQTELSARDTRIAGMETELREARTALEEIRTFNSEMAKDRATRRKEELGTQIAAAREAGNDVKVSELTSELNKITAKEQEPVKPNGASQQQQPVAPQMQPWVKNFIDGNQEFFRTPRKAALFNAVILEKRQAGDARVGEGLGTAFLSEVKSEVEGILNGGTSPRRQAARTEESRSAGGGGGSGAGNGSGQTYSDMPDDARAKCDSQVAKYVGESKLYKKPEDWQRHYAREYFGDQA